MRSLKPHALSAIVAGAALILAVFPFERTSAQSDGALPRRAILPTEIPSPHMAIPPTVAAGYRAPDVEPSNPGIVGVTQNPFVGISLQDAVGMALLRNPNLAVSASNVRIARYRVVEAKANFDVQLQVQPSSNFSVLPPQNIFFAGPGVGGYGYKCVPSYGSGTPEPCSTTGPGYIIQHQYSFQSGVTGQTVNGAQYAAGITQTRTYNNLIINTFNPYYLASLNLSITQPLLKNAGMNAVKHQLKLAFIDADTNEAQALVDASNTIAQVEDAYWNLVAAWRNVAIQEDALKQAVEQQQSVARLARGGVAPPVTVVETQTQVANFQNQLFSALQAVSHLQTQLKSLLVTNAQDPIWNANLVPSSPVQELPNPGELAAVIAVAEQKRPEVRQVIDQRRVADLDRVYARNQALPQADLVVQYQSNGFAGLLQPLPNFETLGCNLPTLTCPTPPPQSQGNATKAFHNMWTGAYPTFNIAVVFNVPLESNTARGLKQIADQELDQAAIERQALDQRIETEARDALQTYQSALSRLSAASQGRESAESVYASEVRRFHSGASTTFLVLQRQVELAQARGRELQAQTDLNKAVVELQRVQGTILTDNGVNLKTLGSKALASASP
ncbi:MAG TPA: TolC family protein [Candidatus Cybelea sp.]|jgi:HAE1 family hydrophobic/amphiphilic exporter-1|nr:TolC family protein [Candidatus Cybelea sp.]